MQGLVIVSQCRLSDPACNNLVLHTRTLAPLHQFGLTNVGTETYEPASAQAQPLCSHPLDDETCKCSVHKNI